MLHLVGYVLEYSYDARTHECKKKGPRNTLHIMPIINPSITEQKKKLHTFMELVTYCTHIFKIIFLTFFFQGSINRISCSQNIAFIRISHFHAIIE